MDSGDVWQIRRAEYPSPLLDQASGLRYEVLHAPFGVSRDDDWNDGDPASTHLVVVVGDDVVGYGRLIADTEERTGQIRQIAVNPAWERRGIGTALIRALLDSARGRGMTDVWLNARLTAVPFYEKLGFKVTSGTFRSPRTYLPHVRMDRAL